MSVHTAAFGLSKLSKRTHAQTILGADLDAGPVTLPNTNGYMQIRMLNNTSGYMFEFFCEGGYGVYPNDVNNRWTILEADLYPAGVTRVYNAENDYTVITPAPDSREYTVIFNNDQGTPPTIELTAGAALAGSTFTMTMTYYRIRPY